jgi:hypothetical protein
MPEGNGKQKCFVIMPFSKTTDEHSEDYWNNHYNQFLKPLIEINPLIETFRSFPLKGDILRQIITDLVTAPIVVADLTDKNPNVYWELGVRQSFKHCTVTIAELGTNLPFDLHTKGTLFYQHDSIKNQKFITDFHTALSSCLIEPLAPDSQVLETIGGRGTLFQIITHEETLRKLDALLAEINVNKDLLDHIIVLCRENAEGRKKDKSFKAQSMTIKFRTMSVESLWVNRYIYADELFYDNLNKYLQGMDAYNDQLSFWTHSPTTFMEGIEKWLIEKKELVSPQIVELQVSITQHRKQISLLF